MLQGAKFEPLEQDDLKNNLFLDPMVLRDCSVSTILNNKSKYFDVITQKNSKRLFKYDLESIKTKNNKINKPIDAIRKTPDLAHFKIWGEALYPGTLAQSLANVILGEVDEERYFKEVCKDDKLFLPNINFCSDYTYHLRGSKNEKKKEKDNAQENIQTEENDIGKNNNQENPNIIKGKNIGQENLYIKLWDETKFRSDNSGYNKDDFGRSVNHRKSILAKE